MCTSTRPTIVYRKGPTIVSRTGIRLVRPVDVRIHPDIVPEPGDRIVDAFRSFLSFTPQPGQIRPRVAARLLIACPAFSACLGYSKAIGTNRLKPGQKRRTVQKRTHCWTACAVSPPWAGSSPSSDIPSCRI
jgi:hypothetical protein